MLYCITQSLYLRLVCCSIIVIHWPSYNQSPGRSGYIFFSYDFFKIWDDNLDKMIENKKGKPYSFLKINIILS